MKRIFLDTAAGALPNPASLHQEGMAARVTLEAARKKVVAVLRASPAEVIFTSGGTESNNLAILGLPKGDVIVSAIEHPSVLAPAAARAAAGRGRVLILPVDARGLVKIKELEKLLTPQTVLVSVMLANNEIGTIQPLAEIAKIVRRARKKFGTQTPYLHTDACQAPRFLPLNVQTLGVDLLTLNSSKLDSVPRGVGVLYCRRGVPLAPILFGGGQEGGRRPGTENVAGAAALAAALAAAQKNLKRDNKKLVTLRDKFMTAVLKNIPGTELNGDPVKRLPNNLNLSFRGVLGEQVVLELDAVGVAVSTGSACAIPKHNDSYVIMALGKTKHQAAGAVRFTLKPEINAADLKFVAKNLIQIIKKLTKQNHDYFGRLAL